MQKIEYRNTAVKKWKRPPSVCFISTTKQIARPILDPSTRYRCYHPAEKLSKQGSIVSICSAKHFIEHPCFDYDIYIFHRPNLALIKIIKCLKALKKIILADYDDLIFGHENYALESSIAKNNTSIPKEKIIQSFKNNLDALKEFNHFFVSTKPLAKKVVEFQPNAQIYIQENELPNSVIKPYLEKKLPFHERKKETIGYFSGTLSHNHDFPIVEDVIYDLLIEKPWFEFKVVGALSLPKKIQKLKNIKIMPVVNYYKLPKIMSECYTVIAPLEKSVFNECKSRVKFLEAAISGCRLVATGIQDMKEVGENHLHIPKTSDEWYQLLANPDDDTKNQQRIRRNVEYISKNQKPCIISILGENH